MCAPEQNQLMAREALIYGLSEASGPLFEVATLTGFEYVRITERNGQKVACRTDAGQICCG